MIEQVTDKVSSTTFLEIIVILLLVLVILIIISNYLLKKKEYKEHDEDKYISVEYFLFIIWWVSLAMFLLIGYFNYFYSGLSILQLLKFTLIETGLIMILTIFLLFNNGYIGHSHLSGYIFAIIIGIFSFASLIGSILLAILTNSLPILAAIGLSSITSLSSLINFSGNNPNDGTPETIEQVEHTDEMGHNQTQELIEQVDEMGHNQTQELIEQVDEMGHKQTQELIEQVDEMGHNQTQNLIEQDNPDEQFYESTLIPQELMPENIPRQIEYVPTSRNYPYRIDDSNIRTIGQFGYDQSNLPSGYNVVDPTVTYRPSGSIFGTNVLALFAATVPIISTLTAQQIEHVGGGCGSKEKQKIIIVMICLILLILDKKK